jgi:hypothetical protein
VSLSLCTYGNKYPFIYYLLLSTTPGVPEATASVVDTGGKLARSVVDTGGTP